MGIQRKLTASLNDERQRKLDEILAEEPLTTPGGLLSLAVEVMYRLWRESGRDLKTVLGAGSALARGAA